VDFLVSPEVVEWVAKRTHEYGNFGSATGIGVQRNGELIAGVVYNEYNGANINMHVAAVEKSRWLSRTALQFFFGYPFNQLGVKRATALVGEGNTQSRRLVEGLGFRLEARLADAHPSGQLLVYVMRPEWCRWTEVRHELKAA
jgi:RimJ/RimL family protein N-acetyltransferase